jgi:hypothetical protein
MNKDNPGIAKGSEERVTSIALPEVQADTNQVRSGLTKKQNLVLLFIIAGLVLVMLFIFYMPITGNQVVAFLNENITTEFLLYVLGGFLAQMVDGALGMAYGLTSTTFLLTMGVPPAAASASVHMSEIFTSGASGLMHLKLKNVNKKLFRLLLIPGICGAILGAYVLSSLEAYSYLVKPLVAIYTLVLYNTSAKLDHELSLGVKT